jgi:hypothetical protein
MQHDFISFPQIGALVYDGQLALDSIHAGEWLHHGPTGIV